MKRDLEKFQNMADRAVKRIAALVKQLNLEGIPPDAIYAALLRYASLSVRPEEEKGKLHEEVEKCANEYMKLVLRALAERGKITLTEINGHTIICDS